MSDATTKYISDLHGRIVECGRSESGKNEAVIDVGRGQRVTISGMSDDLTRQFARNVFRPVRVEFEVQDE